MSAFNIFALVAVFVILAVALVRRIRSQDDDPDAKFAITHSGDVELVSHRRLQSFGARPGDCLVQVDDVRPKSPESALAAARQASRVIVSRNGQIVALPPDEWVAPEREAELLNAATAAFMNAPASFARANPSDGRRDGISATGITLLPH